MGACLVLFPVRVEGVHSDADDIYSAIAEGVEPVDFDKAWHIVHYLLTNSAHASDGPLGILFEGGTKLELADGSEDVHLLSPEQMRAFGDALAQISGTELQRRYDPAAMALAGVYGAHFSDDSAEDSWDDVTQLLSDLRKFAGECVDNGLGALAVLG